VRGFVSPPIGEPLALDALQGVVARLDVTDAKNSTAVVAEIELGQTAARG